MDDHNLCIQVVAMPKDSNSSGDIFGGWLLSQMDLAGLVECKKKHPGRYVTITVDKMIFKKPVYIGDLLSIYCKIINIGNTSITVSIIAKVKRSMTNEILTVTSALFKYVHISEDKKPKKINTE